VRGGGRQAYALVVTTPEGARVEGVLDVALLSRASQAPPPRTKWTRRVPHTVLIGHAASLASQARANAGWALLAALLSLRVGRGGRYVH
jgi:hypothetical protein